MINENPLNVIVYLWSLHLVYNLKFELALTFVTVTELIAVPFGELFSISSIQHCEKKLLLY